MRARHVLRHLRASTTSYRAQSARSHACGDPSPITHCPNSLSDQLYQEIVCKMARVATKFCGPSSKLLLLIVPAFIMLSEAVVTEKTGSCYWCGPLAEQVHRSRRAPPCDAAGNHVTTCDPDLPHCAIVATSPPYVESRLCVKIYQDECYPLFCNSTKTWKMTCPCRGDLCNGPNTLREEEAFAILAKLVTKTRTTRIKKRTQQNAAKFFPINDHKTTIVTNVSEVDNNEISDNLLMNTTNDDLTQIMLGDAPINSDEENDKTLESTEILPTADSIQETTEKIEVSRIKYIMTSSDTNDDILKGLEVLTHKLVNNPVKPSEELPTAEALQQNSSPKTSSDKPVVTTTTIETTIDTTTEASVQTTSTDAESKNNGEDILYKTYLLLHLAAFCLHYVSSYYVM